jgi:flagellar hook-basal body complex protein FliE
MSSFDGLPPPALPRLAPRLIGAELGLPNQPTPGAADFATTLQDVMRNVAELRQDSEHKAMGLVRGEPVHVHDVLVAMGKSEVAFNLVLEVRNRLLQAWETLSRSIL